MLNSSGTNSEGTKICSICLENITTNTILPCGHIFHYICVQKHWKMMSRTCPYCRRKIPFDYGIEKRRTTLPMTAQEALVLIRGAYRIPSELIRGKK